MEKRGKTIVVSMYNIVVFCRHQIDTMQAMTIKFNGTQTISPQKPINKYPSIPFAFGIPRYLVSFFYFDSVNKYVFAFFVAHFPYNFGGGWKLVLKLSLLLYFIWFEFVIIYFSLVYCLVFVEFMMIEF